MDGIARTAAPTAARTAAPTQTRAEERTGARLENAVFGDDGFSFGDLLDVVNPLQHIPIVDTIYRELSHDEIADGPRLVGSHLFGGWLGVGTATLNVAMKHWTGKDMGELVLDLFRPDAIAAPTNAAEPATGSGPAPIGDALQRPPVKIDADEEIRKTPEELRESLLTEARARGATPRDGLWREIERALAKRSAAHLENVAAAFPTCTEAEQTGHATSRDWSA